MHWFKIVLIVAYAISIVGNILMIGDVRKPITPKNAAMIAIVNGLLIWGTIHYL